MLLTTETIVAEKPERQAEEAGHGHGGHGHSH
jgi:chaperonin GroEL